jgi:DNA methylase
VQRDLFADPQLEYQKAVQFYQYDVDWTNRMILGDSLQVIASLARRETLAGKVQMIYVDPPYGIKFASNFQPEIGKRDVKDTEADLTREPEMVKAYRDTWTLGVHSYLAYLRDRLMLCKELLTDTGSIFVQISYENLHRVRAVLDEVFGAENCCAIILMRKSGWSATTPGLLVVQEANSNGHVDITIEAEHAKSVTVRLVEAKIYSGPAYHVKGIEQLLDRYLTGREGQGWILTYVRKDNIKALMVKIRGYLDLEKPCRQQAECEDHRINWAFASKHAHSSGEEINITHMGCNLFYC